VELTRVIQEDEVVVTKEELSLVNEASPTNYKKKKSETDFFLCRFAIRNLINKKAPTN